MSVNVAAILSRKGTDVITVTREAPVTDVIRMLTEHNVGALVVTDAAGEIAGIVSERDIVHQLARAGRATLEMAVDEAMTADVLRCTPEDTADDVMQTMTQRRLRHLPVVDDNGRMVGIVSIGDVVKSRIDDLKTQAESMENYISGSHY